MTDDCGQRRRRGPYVEQNGGGEVMMTFAGHWLSKKGAVLRVVGKAPNMTASVEFRTYSR